MNLPIFTAQEALFGVCGQGQVKFKDRSEIKPWIQRKLMPLGIFIVIERSDETKIVFKCKSYIYSTNFKKVRQKRLTKKEKLQLVSQGKYEEQRKLQRKQNKPTGLCPFRIRANHSGKTNLWTIAIVNNTHNHPLRNSIDSQFFNTERFKSDIAINFKDLVQSDEQPSMKTLSSESNIMQIKTDKDCNPPNDSFQPMNNKPHNNNNPPLNDNIPFDNCNSYSNKPFQSLHTRSKNPSTNEYSLTDTSMNMNRDSQRSESSADTLVFRRKNTDTSQAVISNSTNNNSFNIQADSALFQNMNFNLGNIPDTNTLRSNNFYDSASRNSNIKRTNSESQSTLSPVSAYLNTIAGNTNLLDSIITNVSSDAAFVNNKNSSGARGNKNAFMSELSPMVEKLFTKTNYPAQEYNLNYNSTNLATSKSPSFARTKYQYGNSQSFHSNTTQGSINFSTNTSNDPVSQFSDRSQQRSVAPDNHKYIAKSNFNSVTLNPNDSFRNNPVPYEKKSEMVFNKFFTNQIDGNNNVNNSIDDINQIYNNTENSNIYETINNTNNLTYKNATNSDLYIAKEHPINDNYNCNNNRGFNESNEVNNTSNTIKVPIFVPVPVPVSVQYLNHTTSSQRLIPPPPINLNSNTEFRSNVPIASFASSDAQATNFNVYNPQLNDVNTRSGRYLGDNANINDNTTTDSNDSNTNNSEGNNFFSNGFSNQLL